MSLLLTNPKVLRGAVFGANDGLITTFAVVAGSAGAGLPVRVVLILGLANLLADGVSMGMGDFLAERTEQRLRKVQKQEYVKSRLWESGLATFLAFVLVGSLPLLPYLLYFFGVTIGQEYQFPLSIFSTAVTMFFVGSIRTFVTKGSWWKNGSEMLAIGALAAGVAYAIGALVDSFV